MTKKKETEKKIDWRIVCTGLVCIALIECVALSMGINGTIFSIVLAIIAGAIGVTIPTPKFIKQ